MRRERTPAARALCEAAGTGTGGTCQYVEPGGADGDSREFCEQAASPAVNCASLSAATSASAWRTAVSAGNDPAAACRAAGACVFTGGACEFTAAETSSNRRARCSPIAWPASQLPLPLFHPSDDALYLDGSNSAAGWRHDPWADAFQPTCPPFRLGDTWQRAAAAWDRMLLSNCLADGFMDGTVPTAGQMLRFARLVSSRRRET